MKIYVASSWRNSYQSEVVAALRNAGHEVYDFKNPPGGTGFDWAAIDPAWQSWDKPTYRNNLAHPIAQAGFDSDFNAMKWADACVMVCKCGASAHTEAGWMAGAGKFTIALIDESEPELMYKIFNQVCVTLDEVVESLARFECKERVALEGTTCNKPYFKNELHGLMLYALETVGNLDVTVEDAEEIIDNYYDTEDGKESIERIMRVASKTTYNGETNPEAKTGY